MIGSVKDWAKQRWPRLTLRTYLFASFFLVAALPGVGAVALRVYENALVRQTQGELAAQGAALAASAAVLWPTAAAGHPIAGARLIPDGEIDLSATPILAERPAPIPAATTATDAAEAAVMLRPVFDRTRAATLASTILLDRNGTIASGTTARGSLAQLPEVTRALAGVPATVLRRHAGYRAVYRFEWLSRAAAIRVHHARPVIVDGRVVGVLLLSRSSRSLFVGIYQDWGKIAVGVIAIIAAMWVLSRLLSRAIARPIDALRAAARRVAAGRGDVPPVPPTAAIELQDLYRDFGAMAQAIDTRSRYLRDFAHAVSHEFKTPLAGIRGAIELLQDHEATMTAADRRRFLANADADAARLTLLVSRLLDLARADMIVAGAGETTDIVAAARSVADAHASDRAAIRIKSDFATRRAAIPPATIEAVLTILVENSVKAGAATIILSIEDFAGGVSVTVIDDGDGIPAGDRQRIFEPFFTSRRARGGTGLGLPIARSLLAGVGGSIELLDVGRGTAFRLRLPG